MEKPESIQSLAPGKYVVTSYSPIYTMYGLKYVVTAKYKNQLVKFWSNIILTMYIKEHKPTKSFEITIEREETVNGVGNPYPNKIIIQGYNTPVILGD